MNDLFVPAFASSLTTADAPAVVLRDHVVLPVIEEFLRVDKRKVDSGGYRLTKSVEARVENVDETLESDQVHIERRPIGRTLPTLDAPSPRQEGDTLVVSVVEEVFVRQLVLTEEIRITRTRSTQRHVEQVALRKERIDIERIDRAGNALVRETL